MSDSPHNPIHVETPRWFSESGDGRFLFVPEAERIDGIMAFSLRQGGHSSAPFDSFNFSVKEGDSEGNVAANLSRLLHDVEIEPERLVFADQVHGDHVEVIESAGGPIPTADAMITGKTGLFLGVKTADCLPVLLLDPVRRVAAAIHAGRKGSLSGIASKTLRLMKTEFGTMASDVIAGPGPCIGPCCYEVGDDIASAFCGHGSAECQALTAFRETVEVPAVGIIRARPVNGTRSGSRSSRLDILSVNVEQLVSDGVRKSNLHVMGLCTACYADLFFSHRRDGGRTGRHASVVGFKK